MSSTSSAPRGVVVGGTTSHSNTNSSSTSPNNSNSNTAATATTTTTPALVARPPLDVYKKVTIIRKPTDSVTYEDSEGRLQRVSDLGEAATTSAPTLAPKPKLNIPTPRITIVDSYNNDVLPNFNLPTSYVRYISPPSHYVYEDVSSVGVEGGGLGTEGVVGGERMTIDYNADKEDEDWLFHHPRFGPVVVLNSLLENNNNNNSSSNDGDDGEEGDRKGTAAVVSEDGMSSSSLSGQKKSEKRKQKKRSRDASSAVASSEKNNDKKEGHDAATTTDASSAAPTTTTESKAKATTATSTSETASTTSTTSLTDDDDDLDDNVNLSTLRRRPRLTISVLEAMLDILEKATGFETIITASQAERLLLTKLPVLLHTFGTTPNKKTDLAAAAAKKARKRKQQQQKQSSSFSATNNEPTPSSSAAAAWSEADTPTVRSVISDVYNYWIQKRSKLKRPLLRQYWPVTASNDTNPHMVFRPREKEKYKLRKKRQNDMEAYRKMKQLRKDFERVKTLLDLIKRRERLNLCKLEVGCEVFEQRLYDALDTSGLPRQSCRIGKRFMEEVLDVPKYFDTSCYTSGYGGGSKKKKRRRVSGGSGGGGGGGGGDQASSPTLGGAGGSASSRNRRSSSPTPTSADDLNAASSSAVTPLVAGQDHGHPAPLFLHPLASRESYVTSWENAVPFVSSYCGGHATPTFRFRHRPRVGRGGRIVMDRLPCPGGGGASSAPVNVYTAGDGLPRFAGGGGGSGNWSGNDGGVGEDGGEKKRAEGEYSAGPADRLVDLLPSPLDRARISRRIEEICAEALSDDEDNYGPTVGGRSTSGNASSAGGGSGAGGGGGGGMGLSSSGLSSGMGGGGGMGHGGASASASGVGGGGGASASSSLGMDVDENDGDEVLIRVDDWLDTDEQVWGEERFVIGPV